MSLGNLLYLLSFQFLHGHTDAPQLAKYLGLGWQIGNSVLTKVNY